MHIHLSPYGQASSHPSPVNRMMADFASDFRDGVDINLGIGYVNEKTIPVACLKEAIEAVANDGVKYRQAFNYGGPAGSPNLVESLRQFLALEARNRLIIVSRGAPSILEGLAGWAARSNGSPSSTWSRSTIRRAPSCRIGGAGRCSRWRPGCRANRGAGFRSSTTWPMSCCCTTRRANHSVRSCPKTTWGSP